MPALVAIFKVVKNYDAMMKNNDMHDRRFLENGPWDELYVLTEHWISDLQFYRDDLRFLHHLIAKYFIWITKSENTELVKELKISLLSLGRQGEDLLTKIRRHRSRLGKLVDHTNEQDASAVREEHGHLEDELAEYVKEFRKNRKEVFSITEYIVDSEQMTQLLKP